MIGGHRLHIQLALHRYWLLPRQEWSKWCLLGGSLGSVWPLGVSLLWRAWFPGDLTLCVVCETSERPKHPV